MNKYIIIGGGVLILLVGLIALVYTTGRWSVEQPIYLVTGEEGTFEIRSYPALQWAVTPMKDETGGPFRRLFAFITGENQSAQSIPMTSPVWMKNEGTEGMMAFGISRKIAAAQIPQPRSAEIRLITVPEGSYAVYSDPAITRGEQGMIEVLKKELNSQNRSFEPDPIYAFYDPPWIPQWLSRKEILFRLQSEK